MNFYRLCDYLEDIGIISLDSIKTFLNIYTRLQKKNNKAIIPNNEMRAKYALYNFIKHIASNNTLLLDYSKQIIEKYSNYTALKQQTILGGVVRIMHFKLKLMAIGSFSKIKSYQMKKEDTITTKYKQSNSIQNTLESKHSMRSPRDKRKEIIQDRNIMDKSSKKNQNERKAINRNNTSSFSNKKCSNLSISHHNTICLDTSQRNNNRTNNSNNNNNIQNNYKKALSISINPVIKANDNHTKLHSHRNHSTLDRFYYTQAKYVNDHNDKLYALQLEKQKKMESIYTFKPILNSHQSLRKSRSLTNESIDKSPRYIKLNQDSIIRKNKILQLQAKIEEEEKKNRSHRYKNSMNKISNLVEIPSQFYHEKLYQDAYAHNQRRKNYKKNYYSDMTFQPNNELSQSYERKHGIDTTFHERNQRSIENKRRYQLLNEIEEKENELKKKKERLPKERIEENNRSVIQRLYVKHFEKEKAKGKESKVHEVVSSSFSSNNNNNHNEKKDIISLESLDNTPHLLSNQIKSAENNCNDNKNNDNPLRSNDESNINPKLLSDKITNSHK